MSYKACIAGLFLFEVDTNPILPCDRYEPSGRPGVGVLDSNTKSEPFPLLVAFIPSSFTIPLTVI